MELFCSQAVVNHADQAVQMIHSKPSNIRGAIWVVVAAFFFSSMNAIAKSLQGTEDGEVSALQLTFFRYAVAALVLAPVVLLRQNLWKPSHPVRYSLRTLAGFGGIVLMFVSLKYVPLAEATAIGFTSPIFAVLFAAVFLGESLSRRRWVSVGIGMSGALLVVQASATSNISYASLIPLIAAIFMGLEVVSIKWLSQSDDHMVTIVFYSNIAGAVLSILLAIPFWMAPSFSQMLSMIALGSVAVAGQLCVLQGIRLADASFIAPMFYSSLVFSAITGYIVFSELPSILSIIGCFLILAGAYIQTKGERTR